MANLKQLSKLEERFLPGHRACAGCSAPTIVRQVLMAAGETPVVCGCATGCLEIFSSIYPYTAWGVPWFHSAFENSAATVSGMEAAYRSLKRQGKYSRDVRFIAFGGDGGTYDIGFQSLSGAMERGHRMLYVCYDNEAYMNTGIQRSGSTPRGAHTTTSPAGSVIPGKVQHRKDLTEAMVAHDIPYVAQAIPSQWNDMVTKVQKALNVDGPSFINVLQPCRLGWGFDPAETVEMCRLAIETCFWPIYEVENGVHKLSYRPKTKRPVEDFLKTQDRFRHLWRAGNQHLVGEIQEEVDHKWERLLKRCECGL
jgi:pyruvate ferredoxin oxidoreductase beta subunit